MTLPGPCASAVHETAKTKIKMRFMIRWFSFAISKLRTQAEPLNGAVGGKTYVRDVGDSLGNCARRKHGVGGNGDLDRRLCDGPIFVRWPPARRGSSLCDRLQALDPLPVPFVY